MEITVLLLIIVILLTFMCGYTSLSEISLFSLPSTKLKTFEKSNDPRKQLIADLLKHPRDLLVTIFMLNTISSILLQNAASSLFGEGAGWDLKVGVPLVLMVLFGEIIPKNLGIQNNENLAYYVAPSVNFFKNAMRHIRRFTIAITAPISRVMFFFLKKNESISKEELKHVLKKSKEHGVLTPEEAELLWGYLDLQDSTVKEIMRPREDILYYDINDPISKLTYLCVDQQCSRLPVCDQTLDNILGIVSAKNFFLQKDSIHSSKDVRNILSKPFYIPEGTDALILLRRLEESNEEIALAVDEYSSISGLIAYEDIVELVVGKISDLRDQKNLYTRAGENEIIASGKLELSEFNDIFDTNLESPNHMVTIGGWLTEQLEEIPKTGTSREIEGFLFQVLAADPQRIRRLYIRKLGASP